MVHTGRALIVCQSVHHHNTARVARAMAEVLGAEVVVPADCPADRLVGCTLLGVGSGVYYGRPHEELRRWAQGLPEPLCRRLPAFVFTTSGLPFLAWFWHRPLRSTLAGKGMDIVGTFACRGFDTWGPLWLAGGLNREHPDDRDLERARAFAAGLTEVVRRDRL